MDQILFNYLKRESSSLSIDIYLNEGEQQVWLNPKVVSGDIDYDDIGMVGISFELYEFNPKGVSDILQREIDEVNNAGEFNVWDREYLWFLELLKTALRNYKIQEYLN
jgi:hypothetical protein